MTPFLRKLLDYALELLFPRSCVGCGKLHTSLCRGCFEALPPSLESNGTHIKIYSMYDYGDPVVKKALWRLKYKGDTEIISLFSGVLYDHLVSFLEEIILFERFEDPLLIHVPSSRRKKMTRGFNQTELIAKKLGQIDRGNIFTVRTDVVRKSKHTQNQTEIKNRKKRIENIKGAFRVRKNGAARGKNIILIDDIYTTGETLNEIARTLKKDGARKVIAFTIAH